MKCKQLSFLLPLLLMAAIVFSQEPDIVSRIIAKDSNLVIYPQNGWPSAVALAAVDRQTHVLSLVTRYGEEVDAVQLSTPDYRAIQYKKLTPFEYYNRYCDFMIEVAMSANSQLCSRGQIDPSWKYAGLVHALSPKIETHPHPLEKISCVDNISGVYMYNKWLLNNKDPKYLFEDTATLYTDYSDANAGTMLVEKDTVFYCNKNIFARAYRAMLVIKDAKLVFSDRNNHRLDSLILNPGTIHGLVEKKTDVFLYYRGWLEMQKEGAIAKLLLLDSVARQNPGLLVQFVGNKLYAIPALLKSLNTKAETLLQKIGYIAVPDAKTMATIVHYDYKEFEEHHVMLNTLNLVTVYSFTRGRKRYEITDHRGNVVAVVSDKKLAHTSNGTTVDYYNADVVSATDYAPFGMQTRTMQNGNAGNGYPYGHNGKMKDDEVKGEGNQVDYGMRIYDPRVGRFLSVDPLTPKYPELTPYQFASNRPIDGKDLDGLEWQGQIIYDIFIGPFVDYGSGAKKYMEGTVQKAAAQTGNASYQNSNVPQAVQDRFAKGDVIEGTSKQIHGATEMHVATAEVINTYAPLGTEAVFAERVATKAGQSFRKLSEVELRKVMEGADDWRMVYSKQAGQLGDAIVTNQGTTLELNIVIPKKFQGQGMLNEIMQKAVKEFNVNSVKGIWKYDAVKYKDFGGMSTNLKVFMENRVKMGDIKAAWSTPTGQAAQKTGFTHVNVKVEMVNGNSLVNAVFSK